MKLLIFSLLLCFAWAQEDALGQEQVTESEVGEGGSEVFDDGVEMSAEFWHRFYGRSYMFLNSSVNWSHAQHRCLSLSGHLATIHNIRVENFLKQLTRGQTSWIGLTDKQQDGHWFWINGQPLRYTNWCRGEPNNAGGLQDCAAINFSDNKCWDDTDCWYSYPFVCERR